MDNSKDSKTANIVKENIKKNIKKNVKENINSNVHEIQNIYNHDTNNTEKRTANIYDC